MSLIDLSNLEKIKPTVVSSIVICLCSFFCVEFMIFLLNRNLFISLDIYKLICIGIGITSPLLLCNTIILSPGVTNRDEFNIDVINTKFELLPERL